jgi:hypothetical protein
VEVMMAGDKPSISRRRVLGAAALLPVAALAAPSAAHVPIADAVLWKRRLASYRRIAARAAEAAESGWFRAASDRFVRECADIAARFGGEAAQSEDARRLHKAAFRRMDRAEDAYWRRCTAPMQEAAVALVLTPAPDLPAVRAKIAAVRAHALEELEVMPRHPLDVMDEDLARMIPQSRQESRR